MGVADYGYFIKLLFIQRVLPLPALTGYGLIKARLQKKDEETTSAERRPFRRALKKQAVKQSEYHSAERSRNKK